MMQLREVVLIYVLGLLALRSSKEHSEQPQE